MAHPNVDRLREGYEAFAKGDMETVGSLWSDDIGWHSFGNSPFSGHYKGKQEVFGVLAKIPQVTDQFSQEIHDIVGNDEHVVAMVRQTIGVDGDVTTFDSLHVWHMTDGTATEAWIVPMDQEEANKIWG